MRQSSCAWNSSLHATLFGLGLSATYSNPSFYVYIEDDLLLLLLVYVNDIMLTGNHIAKITLMSTILCSKYDMSLLGFLTLYLSVELISRP